MCNLHKTFLHNPIWYALLKNVLIAKVIYLKKNAIVTTVEKKIYYDC